MCPTSQERGVPHLPPLGLYGLGHMRLSKEHCELSFSFGTSLLRVDSCVDLPF